MGNEAEEIFGKLKKDLTEYAQLKLELVKLDAYERLGRTMAQLTYGIILVALAFFVVLFLFLALGLFLGEIFNSQPLGFSAVAGLYIIVIILTCIFGKKIRKRILNGIIYALTISEDREDLENDLNDVNKHGESTTDTTREVDC